MLEKEVNEFINSDSMRNLYNSYWNEKINFWSDVIEFGQKAESLILEFVKRIKNKYNEADIWECLYDNAEGGDLALFTSSEFCRENYVKCFPFSSKSA